MKTKFIVLFLGVIIFSFIIRLFYLTSVPEGFEQTEAAFAYDAYSIFKTGRDEYGKLFPLVLTSIGDYKLAGYTYWQIPFIALLGLNVFAARFSSVVASIICLILIYDITFLLFKNRKIALLTLFIASISPWLIVFSRMGFDPIVSLMSVLLSISLFIRFIKLGNIYFLLLSSLALSFGILVYYAVWVIIPLISIIYFIYLWKDKVITQKLVISILILLIPWLTLTKLYFVTQGQRLSQDSTFQATITPLLQEQIREDQNEFPLIITRAFHNKLIFYPHIIFQTLFKNLSFDFLFLYGDKTDRRFYVPYNGVLLLWSVPFLLLGLLYFIKNYPMSKTILIISIIFFVFLGSSFSEFGSESERTLIALPIFAFLISYGLDILVRKRTRQYISTILVSLIVLFFSANVAFFNHQYYWHGNVHQPWGRSFGTEEMITTVNSLKNKYKEIVVPDNTYIFFYFYNKVNPDIAIKNAERFHSKTSILGLNMRTYAGDYLTMPIDCPTSGKLDYLYVCQGNKIPKNSKIIKVIYYRDDQPSYIIIELTRKISQSILPKNVSFGDTVEILNENKQNYW